MVRNSEETTNITNGGECNKEKSNNNIIAPITTNDKGEIEFDIETTGDAVNQLKAIPVPFYCHYKVEEVSCSLKNAKLR